MQRSFTNKGNSLWDKLQSWLVYLREHLLSFWDAITFPFSIILRLILQETLRMLRTIISDTSCFIILTNIGELDLLQLTFGEIVTTEEVIQELGEELPSWILVKAATDKYRQQILETQVDRGEASAIALALEFPESRLILDDYKARKIAENLGLEITGTIGVFIIAKKRGIIKSIKPYLEKIRATNFRLSNEIEKQALKEAEE